MSTQGTDRSDAGTAEVSSRAEGGNVPTRAGSGDGTQAVARSPLRNPFHRFGEYIKSIFGGSDVKVRSARILFQSVEMEYRGLEGLPGSPDDPKAREIAEELLKKFADDPRSVSIADAVLFERMVVRLLPADILRRKASHLRDHFRRLIEPQEYQLYVESGPPDPLRGDEKALRTDLEALLNRINSVYSISPFREEMRTRITTRISLLLVLFLAFATAIILIQSSRGYRITALLPLAITGAIGGFVSVQQRIQSAPAEGDAIRGVLSLADGLFSVYLSPLTGAISATVLYLLFVGGLLKGSLFPDISGGPETGGAMDFQSFLAGVGPKDSTEFAKLLVWGFIAGFAERLVPDTLNRLVASVETGAQAKPPAVVEARESTTPKEEGGGSKAAAGSGDQSDQTRSTPPREEGGDSKDAGDAKPAP